MAIPDQGMDLPGEQVDARHQGDCSVPLVLVIASDRRMSCGNRRQIGSRRADRLDAWFLVVRDDRDRRSARATRRPAHRHLAVHAENFSHFRLELGIAPLQVVTNFMRFHIVRRQDFAHRPWARCARLGWPAPGP